MSIISLKNLYKSYGAGENETKALKKINLEISKGEMIAIMGPSGCGKSTLLNIIGCIDNVTSGEYYLEDNKVENLSGDQLADIRNKKISFIFQNFALIKEFSVLDNILLPLDFREKVKGDKEKAKKVMEELDILDLQNKKVSKLSGGQQQRVAIARALITDSKIILADEPTGALDQENGQLIMNILMKLNKEKGKTIIIVTHDINVAEFADYIIKMRDGYII